MTWLIGIRSNVFSPCGAAVGVICLALAMTIGCQRSESPKSKESESKPEARSEKGSDKDTPKTAAKPTTGREVLGRMLEAYRNASSYSDIGTACLSASIEGQKVPDQTIKFSLAFVRPNKVRIQAYGAEVICDGKKLYGCVPYLPDQVLVRPAPEQLTIRTAQPDFLIADAMNGMNRGFAGRLPQIAFLFGKEPLDAMLAGLDDVELAKPGEIDGHECYRVKLNGPDGVATFWIDEKSFVLRRVILPTATLRQMMSQEAGPIESLSVVADFTGAQINGNVDPKTFEFAVSEGVKMVDFLVPLDIRQLLNKKLPDLKAVDLAGKPVTSETIAGKTAVLVFWSIRYPSCRQPLKDVEEMSKKYRDDPRLAFYAVCTDPQEYKTSDLEKFVANEGIRVPVVRDADTAVTTFKLGMPPSTIIINDKGIVQHCECGPNPRYAESLQTKLDRVLAGEEIYQEPLKQYEDQIEQFKKYANEPETAAAEPADKGIVKVEHLPEVKIAQRSEPTAFRLAPLWKSADVKNPGNIFVVAGKTGPERLLVIENATAVAEVGLDGKLITTHGLNLAPSEIVGSLSTAVGADGRRYFVAFLVSQQRCHVFDENWNLVAHYPEDALKNPHSGIADVRLGDLDGDGKLKLYVSYWDVVGVQAVSLDGNRLWKNRSAVSDVGCIAIGGPDAKGRRDLFCTTNSGVVVLDAQGSRRGEIHVRNRLFNWIANSDLRGDGEPLWCGLAAVKAGDNIAVGFSPGGDELWNYPLPAGIQQQPIEPIISGRLTRNGPGQWLLPGPDGSIHVVSADGKLLDKFNYGSMLQGMATVEINGQSVLVVASPKGLEAWKVE